MSPFGDMAVYYIATPSSNMTVTRIHLTMNGMTPVMVIRPAEYVLLYHTPQSVNTHLRLSTPSDCASSILLAVQISKHISRVLLADTSVAVMQ